MYIPYYTKIIFRNIYENYTIKAYDQNTYVRKVNPVMMYDYELELSRRQLYETKASRIANHREMKSFDI